MISNPEFMRLLVSKGILTEQESGDLIKRFRGDAFTVLTYLVQEDKAEKSELGRLWGDSKGVAYVELEKTLFQPQVVQKLPLEFARKNQMIPVYQFGDVTTVATSNISNRYVLEEAKRIMGGQISLVFAFPDEIKYAIEVQYQSDDAIKGLTEKIPVDILSKDTTKITTEDLKKLAGDQAVIEFARAILLLGIKERASDIHIEPGENDVRIRFRIDGMLQERIKLERPLLAPLVSRLKIMANADIAEKRKPQDGRINLSFSDRSIDFRFSSVSTIYGEKIVLRILGQIQRTEVPDLSDLFFSNSVLNSLKKAIKSPNGIFFVTGPTGSGKSSTLYSALKYINKPETNIMTIEDPVEYRLPGVNQVQVNASIGLDFAVALRAFLRQDPDVILVGEIRDLETAKIASEAALTGHLVLATLHTNNSIQAITRLIEIGVEPFLVSPSVIGAMAQRLVRRICDNCKEKYRLSAEEIERLFIWDGKREVFFYRGKGCPQCKNTGYSGRIAIHEIFLVNDELRTLIGRNAPINEIKESAMSAGYKPLRYDGIKKVLRGLTTIEEIDRVTIVEE